MFPTPITCKRETLDLNEKVNSQSLALRIARTIKSWFRGLKWFRSCNKSARDTFDQLLEVRDVSEVPIDDQERTLLANILELRGRTIADVMVPRADIFALQADAGLQHVINTMMSEGHSRLPIYRDNLDDAFGFVHIKDVLAWWDRKESFSLAKVQRKALFVAPSMQVMELILEMRATRLHMALVVDEYGGVDGLVTIEDLVEEIVGEIQDEHDHNEDPDLIFETEETFLADARLPVRDLEEKLGQIFAMEELTDIGTLGGAVFTLAGRVPIRGEVVSHSSGVEFEIVEADPRRVKRIRVWKQKQRSNKQDITESA